MLEFLRFSLQRRRNRAAAGPACGGTHMNRERALKVVLGVVGLIFLASAMGLQAFHNIVARVELVGVALLVVIGVALIALAPARQVAAQTSTTAPAGSLPLPSKPTVPGA